MHRSTTAEAPNSAPWLGKKSLLSVVLCANAFAALLTLTVSMATDFWIVTFEWEAERNGTHKVTAMHSGLWRLCAEQKLVPSSKKTVFIWTEDAITFNGHRSNCTRHNSWQIADGILFKHRRDGGDMKPTDIHIVQAASPLPLVGSLLAVAASISSLRSAYRPQSTRPVLLGGALYVISGLFLLIGIVLYIGNVSQAFDGSSGGISSDNRYAYAYGYSFHLFVVGFTLSETAGVLAVYLHLARARHADPNGGAKPKNSASSAALMPNDEDEPPSPPLWANQKLQQPPEPSQHRQPLSLSWHSAMSTSAGQSVPARSWSQLGGAGAPSGCQCRSQEERELAATIATCRCTGSCRLVKTTLV